MFCFFKFKLTWIFQQAQSIKCKTILWLTFIYGKTIAYGGSHYHADKWHAHAIPNSTYAHQEAD
jgi:hypothetical protein